MLVVITIISIIISGVVLSVGVVGRDTSLKTETRRLSDLLEYVRDRAELESRDYGLKINRTGYEFLRYEPRTSLWVIPEDESLRPRKLPTGLLIELDLEGRTMVLASTKKETILHPQLGVQANGDYTPFELRMRREGNSITEIIRPNEEGGLTTSESEK